ncbi:MAG: hypothetical protein RR994_06285, partial [Clostridia bacterium]
MLFVTLQLRALALLDDKYAASEPAATLCVTPLIVVLQLSRLIFSIKPLPAQTKTAAVGIPVTVWLIDFMFIFLKTPLDVPNKPIPTQSPNV